MGGMKVRGQLIRWTYGWVTDKKVTMSVLMQRRAENIRQPARRLSKSHKCCIFTSQSSVPDLLKLNRAVPFTENYANYFSGGGMVPFGPEGKNLSQGWVYFHLSLVQFTQNPICRCAEKQTFAWKLFKSKLITFAWLGRIAGQLTHMTAKL